MKKITTIFAGILLSLQGFSQWSLTGNAGTNPAVNFLGTTDAQRLVFRTNNVERMTTLSTAKLHVNCTAIAGKSNPSNIRFQNLQSGSGSFLVIDSNGYVYKASSGTASAMSTRPEALNVDLQNEIENLKNQVQELRSLIVS